jgi:hypothetical protein
MRQVSKAAQEQTVTTNVLETATTALSLAEDALIKAKEALAAAGGSKGSKGGSKGKAVTIQPQTPVNGSDASKGSAGRNPSPEQLEIRSAIIEALQSGEIRFFTIAEVTDAMKADRIQTRNAVNYLEAQGVVTRYGEKLPEGRGQRELIYKAGTIPPVA